MAHQANTTRLCIRQIAGGGFVLEQRDAMEPDLVHVRRYTRLDLALAAAAERLVPSGSRCQQGAPSRERCPKLDRDDNSTTRIEIPE